MKMVIPLTKIDEEKRLVYGRAAHETPDKTGEIMDYETAKPVFEAWSKSAFEMSGGKSKGNVRVMHTDVAAGKFIDVTYNDKEKAIDVVAKVVDDNEWQKCLDGVYTGFSIGGSYERRWKDGEHTRYTPKISEVSLVDNPCIPTARFYELVKRDGSKELRKFQEAEEYEMFADVMSSWGNGGRQMKKGEAARSVADGEAQPKIVLFDDLVADEDADEDEDDDDLVVAEAKGPEVVLFDQAMTKSEPVLFMDLMKADDFIEVKPHDRVYHTADGTQTIRIDGYRYQRGVKGSVQRPAELQNPENKKKGLKPGQSSVETKTKDGKVKTEVKGKQRNERVESPAAQAKSKGSKSKFGSARAKAARRAGRAGTAEAKAAARTLGQTVGGLLTRRSRGWLGCRRRLFVLPTRSSAVAPRRRRLSAGRLRRRLWTPGVGRRRAARSV